DEAVAPQPPRDRVGLVAELRLDVFAGAHVPLERALGADALRGAAALDGARVLGAREGREALPYSAELCGELVGRACRNVADRLETELTQTRRRLLAGAPKHVHRQRREPRARLVLRHDREPIRLAKAARDFRDVLRAREADRCREPARHLA